jgi:hypothetical protein
VLAPLAVLDAALATAEETLLAYHTPLEELMSTFEGCPPPSCVLAALLIARLGELHELLGHYRLVCQPHPDYPDDDGFPF